VRYYVNAPTTAGGHHRSMGSAMTPFLTRPAAAWSSRGCIHGSPGTEKISAPFPSAVSQHYLGLMNAGTHRSSDSPPQLFPSLYYLVGSDQEHAPVSRISDNQMPVPAVRAPNVIIAKPYQSRKGGQRQVVQPQVVQRFPGMYGRNG
jgi:hypothetical protein